MKTNQLSKTHLYLHQKLTKSRIRNHKQKQKKTLGNIPNLRDGLNSFMTKIITKPADKGSIVVITTPEFYWKMCQSHLNNE